MKKAIYSAADYEVPQERHRVIIFGVNKQSKLSLESFYKALDELKSKNPKKTVRDAIGDMPKFRPLDEPRKENGRNV